MRIGRLAFTAVVAAVTAAMTPLYGQSSSGGPRQVPERFTMAVGGDLLVGGGGATTSLSDLLDADRKKVISLFQSADAGFANAESSIFDRAGFKGWPAPLNGGGYPLHSPSLVADLKKMGIDLFSLANNHATDWGTEGVVATLRTMDSLGLAHAGAGMNMKEARAPGYFRSPLGTVALVATTSSFSALSPAADASGRSGSRPGASTLRTTASTFATQEEMEALARVAAIQQRGRGGRGGGPSQTGTPRQITVAGTRFVLSDRRGRTYEANEEDVKEITGAVAEAERNADLVVLSIHAHESSTGPNGETIPGDFLPGFFHAAIDSGADVVVRHGPHSLAGIEIYKGRPIFYDMGSLFFGIGDAQGIMTTNGRQGRLPDNWYDGAIALVEFRGGRLHEVRMVPMIFDRTAGAVRAAPKAAPPEAAARILESLRSQSARYGTVLRIENGVGIIRGPDGK